MYNQSLKYLEIFLCASVTCLWHFNLPSPYAAAQYPSVCRRAADAQQ